MKIDESSIKRKRKYSFLKQHWPIVFAVGFFSNAAIEECFVSRVMLISGYTSAKMNLSLLQEGRRGKKRKGRETKKYIISASSISQKPLACQSCHNFISE